MNRQQKEAVVEEFNNMLSQAKASFLVDYKGLSVHDIIALRRSLREQGGKLKVTKARLMKIATNGIEGVEEFKDSFKDQVGMIFASEEVAPVAKVIVDFSKDNESLKLVSGFYESRCLSEDKIKFLASLPPKEVLIAQLAGTLQAPISGLARSLNMLVKKLVYALKEVEKKKTRE